MKLKDIENSNQIAYLVFGQIDSQLYDQIWIQIETRNKDQIENQIYRQITNQILDQIWDSIEISIK